MPRTVRQTPWRNTAKRIVRAAGNHRPGSTPAGAVGASMNHWAVTLFTNNGDGHRRALGLIRGSVDVAGKCRHSA